MENKPYPHLRDDEDIILAQGFIFNYAKMEFILEAVRRMEMNVSEEEEETFDIDPISNDI